VNDEAATERQSLHVLGSDGENAKRREKRVGKWRNGETNGIGPKV